jgi:UDP-N-acetylmuramoyl-tripeptide--D-alanyl-D-alanine ligase
MFKTVENIMATKYELIESLPQNGIAVFNGDDENCVRLAEKTTDKKVLLYGCNKSHAYQHLTASDIATTNNGVAFMVRSSTATAVAFRSRLLGRHNVSNIMAAVMVSLELGMFLEEISTIVRSLEPTPHRLQLIQGAGGVTVLDDAFNANPVGAKIALETLNEFRGGRKILITPGLVELGEKEWQENKQLGLQAANVCDLVFLVGPKRTRPIFEGLIQAGFPEKNIFIEKSLSSATERFKYILKAGDVVLFENDLPDNYNE